MRQLHESRPYYDSGPKLEALAQKYTAEAVDALAGVMRSADSPAAARVAAATALLDRGHGKPRQQIEHTGELDGASGPPVVVILPDNGRSAT